MLTDRHSEREANLRKMEAVLHRQRSDFEAERAASERRIMELRSHLASEYYTVINLIPRLQAGYDIDNDSL